MARLFSEVAWPYFGKVSCCRLPCKVSADPCVMGPSDMAPNMYLGQWCNCLMAQGDPVFLVTHRYAPYIMQVAASLMEEHSSQHWFSSLPLPPTPLFLFIGIATHFTDHWTRWLWTAPQEVNSTKVRNMNILENKVAKMNSMFRISAETWFWWVGPNLKVELVQSLWIYL